jgi:4-hydroxy-tetrahydrodipicolinate synthase
VVKRVLGRAGRVPVVVGVSSSGIDPLAQLSRFAMDQGAAGVMIAPMSGLRTDEQIINYFSRVCERMGDDISVVLQDYPQSTNVYFSAPRSSGSSISIPRS